MSPFMSVKKAASPAQQLMAPVRTHLIPVTCVRNAVVMLRRHLAPSRGRQPSFRVLGVREVAHPTSQVELALEGIRNGSHLRFDESCHAFEVTSSPSTEQATQQSQPQPEVVNTSSDVPAFDLNEVVREEESGSPEATHQETTTTTTITITTGDDGEDITSSTFTSTSTPTINSDSNNNSNEEEISRAPLPSISATKRAVDHTGFIPGPKPTLPPPFCPIPPRLTRSQRAAARRQGGARPQPNPQKATSRPADPRKSLAPPVFSKSGFTKAVTCHGGGWWEHAVYCPGLWPTRRVEKLRRAKRKHALVGSGTPLSFIQEEGEEEEEEE